MIKYLAGSVAAACLLTASQSAQSTFASVSAEAPGALLPSLPLATVLTFDDLPVGSLPSYRFRGGTLSGSGAKEDTTLVGEYAQPAGDATEFFTVSYLYPSGAVNLVFNNPENCFGLYCVVQPLYRIQFRHRSQRRGDPEHCRLRVRSRQRLWRSAVAHFRARHPDDPRFVTVRSGPRATPQVSVVDPRSELTGRLPSILKPRISLWTTAPVYTHHDYRVCQISVHAAARQTGGALFSFVHPTLNTSTLPGSGGP